MVSKNESKFFFFISIIYFVFYSFVLDLILFALDIMFERILTADLKKTKKSYIFSAKLVFLPRRSFLRNFKAQLFQLI